MARYDAIRVSFPKSILDRKDIVKYLVLVNWHAKQLEDIVQKAPEAAFNRFIETQVATYLKGTPPPEAIQTAVMNMAEDVLACRDVTLKAGDYIALQNHYRNMKR